MFSEEARRRMVIWSLQILTVLNPCLIKGSMNVSQNEVIWAVHQEDRENIENIYRKMNNLLPDIDWISVVCW